MRFKDVTAPGFFDFSSSQSEGTKKLEGAFDNFFKWLDSQEELFHDVFKNWQNRNYEKVKSRSPFVAYQLNRVGMSWFRGGDTEAVLLASYLLAGFGTDFFFEFQRFQKLLEKLKWATSEKLSLVKPESEAAKLAEELIIYTRSTTKPAKPATSAYTARSWTPPASWHMQVPAGQDDIYVSYGQPSTGGKNINWSNAYRVDEVSYFFDSNPQTNITTAKAGDVAITPQPYYYTGTSWLRYSTYPEFQGLPPNASIVVGPDGVSLSSNKRTPTDSRAMGYGMYAGLSTTKIFTDAILVDLVFTSEGAKNLAAIIYIMRKLKPALNDLEINYTSPGDKTHRKIKILDANQI